MAESPFKFFRGAAIIQARGLANARVSGITVQACGDCHLMHFGGFASPERMLVFDINDFDETFPGPWEWDIKRLGTSLVLAAKDRSLSKTIADEAVRAATASYRKRMSEFARSSCVGSLVTIFLARFLFGPWSYAAGAPGGFFAPLLVPGACSGALFAGVLNHSMPRLGLSPVAFAVVGMAALFSAWVRAPLTGIVLAVEMTGRCD